MNASEFKKIARILKQVYGELEQEALTKGIDILSPEYQILIGNAREAVLSKMGFTLDQYRQAKARVEDFSQEDLVDEIEAIKGEIRKVDEKHIPTSEEIAEIAYDIAQEFIKPPQITNEIVKEITVEKPTIVEKRNYIVEKVEYDEKPLLEKMEAISKKLEESKGKEVDVVSLKKELQEEFTNAFGEMFEKNINTLGMPNFRKLAMGLQAQIDELSAGGGGSTPGGVSGDVQYNNAGALGGITSVATGNALISGGVGAVPTWGKIGLATHVSGDLLFSNLTQGSALSVLGVTGNATADVASIAAGTNHQVLRRSGTALGFGAVDLAQSAAVTGVLPFANGGGISALGASRIPFINSSNNAWTSSSDFTNSTTIFTAFRFTVQNFGASGTWLGWPSGTSALGLSSSVGGETFIARAGTNSAFMSNSLIGDILYRTGGRILLATGPDSGDVSQVMLDDHFFGIGDSLVPLARLHVQEADVGDSCIGTATVSCSDFNATDEATCQAVLGCTWDSGPSECSGTPTCGYGDQGSCEAVGCTWGGATPVARHQRWSQDASNYAEIVVDATGNTTFSATGTSPEFTFSDPVNFTDIQCDSITNDTGLAHGTYTPTLTNTTNIGASTARLSTYMRVGDTVTVAGQVDIDPTATGAVLLGISLPTASNFSTAYQAGGTICAKAFVEAGMIEADATNDRVSANFIAVDTTNHTFGFTFTYQVI